METTTEPWLRGTLTEVDAVRRGVLHALELALEDVERWCDGLTDVEMNARPFDIAPVTFHLRHIARSLDRLLTYAEGRQLGEEQGSALRSELEGGASAASVLQELRKGLADAARRVLAISSDSYEQPREVGRKMLPTTVGGLLVHCADHTLRHVGQAITTVKVIVAMRNQ
jgi:uncharacterized damage-inducible protein DinB